MTMDINKFVADSPLSAHILTSLFKDGEPVYINDIEKLRTQLSKFLYPTPTLEELQGIFAVIPRIQVVSDKMVIGVMRDFTIENGSIGAYFQPYIQGTVDTSVWKVAFTEAVKLAVVFYVNSLDRRRSPSQFKH